MQARTSTLILSLCTLLLATPALAKNLRGKIVGVTDGDTITLLDSKKHQYKIRLTGIDAPEKSQPFGQASKESLSELVYWRNVSVTWNKTDRYQRVLGKVKVGKTDANLQQLKRGLAWYYKDYEKELPTTDRKSYFLAQHQAKLTYAGLWSEDDAIAPWEWRKENKANQIDTLP